MSDWSRNSLSAIFAPISNFVGGFLSGNKSVEGYINVLPLLTLKEDEAIQQLPDNIRKVILGTAEDETSDSEPEPVTPSTKDKPTDVKKVPKKLMERVEESKDFLDPMRRIGVERKESVKRLVGRFESLSDLKNISKYAHKAPPPEPPKKKPDEIQTPRNPDVEKPAEPVAVVEEVPQPALEEQAPFRGKVKEFLESDEDYILHLGRIIPDCYQKPIQAFRKKQDVDERNFELLDVIFNKLAKQLASDPAHMRMFTLKRTIVSDTNRPLSHDVKAVKIMCEMVMQFVKDTLCKKYIPYVSEYIAIRPKIQMLLNDEKVLRNYVRDNLNKESEQIQKNDKSLIKVLTLEEMMAEPCRRLTIYLTTFRDEWYPYIKDAQISSQFNKSKEDQDVYNQSVLLLENACSKLEREMKTHFMQLEKAFQMNKIYEIQRKIGIDNIANETTDILYSNSALAMKKLSQKQQTDEPTVTERISSIPNFIYESMDNSEYIYRLDESGKRLDNYPYAGYLFENMFIISGIDAWQGKRENKLFNLKGCSIECTGERRITLSISGEPQLTFESQTQKAHNRWYRCLQSVCETGFFSTETAKKLAKHIREHSSLSDSPQDYFSSPLADLYANPETWSCFDDNEYNILYEKTDTQSVKKPIRAASLEKLIQILTSPDKFDQSFLFSFMLTYQSFTTSEELVQLLVNRYNIPPPQDKVNDSKAFIQYKENTLLPVRIRVCQVLKHWIQHHSHVFRGDARVRNKISLFIEQHIAKTKLFSLADELRDDLEKFAHKRDTFAEQQLKMLSQKVNAMQLANPKAQKSNSLGIDAPKPRVPRSLKSFALPTRGRGKSTVSNVIDWPSLEIARQLTLIQFSVYEQIQVKECLNQAWSKGYAPNIRSMIDRTNIIVLFIGYEILKQESQSNRVHALQKWIKVCRECRKINNFNACREIVGGLRQVAVSRLSKTWEKVDPKLKKEFEEILELVAQKKNYKEMRSALSSVAPPCLPYIGMYLQDLTFIDEGNKDNVPNTNEKPKNPNVHAPYKPELINFFKRQKIGVIIRGLQQYQTTPYIFLCVPELANRLQNMITVPESKLIEMSLAVESE
jgi:hypothetical protein